MPGKVSSRHQTSQELAANQPIVGLKVIISVQGNSLNVGPSVTTAQWKMPLGYLELQTILKLNLLSPLTS